MTDHKHTITINDQRSALMWLARSLSITACTLAPIVVGVIVDSPAMQWVGFLFGVLLVFAVSIRLHNEHTVHSIAEARAVLDRLENEQR